MKFNSFLMLVTMPIIWFGLCNVVLAAKPDSDGTGKITLSCNIKEILKKYSNEGFDRETSSDSTDYSGTIALNLADNAITFISNNMPYNFDTSSKVDVSSNAITIHGADGFKIEIDRVTGNLSGYLHIQFGNSAHNEVTYSGRCTKVENNAF